MPPLILHNVPDEELYIGEDGVQRPYAMLFPGIDGNGPGIRSRRTAPETGSFGKSTRRSKSRTGTPAAKREDPTLSAADLIFSNFFSQNTTEKSERPIRSSLLSSASQPSLLAGKPERSSFINPTSRYSLQRHKDPTEVILRGFKSSQQYAAIREFERIAGRICEDYSRDPPSEQRKFKADLRDPASLRAQPLTPEEKAKAFKFAGGEHWIKVTFTSAEDAETAIECSPQRILGHLVYAELYHGIPPLADEEILASDHQTRSGQDDFLNAESMSHALEVNVRPIEGSYINSRSLITTSTIDHEPTLISPGESQPSSVTFPSGTFDAYTSPTLTESTPILPPDGEFCQRIPTARKMRLLSAEHALLPQQSPFQKFLSSLPVIGWVSRDVIGGVLPRTEHGEFDYKNASLYWKLMWFIEKYTGITIIGDPKDD